jgi:hypothetical protein
MTLKEKIEKLTVVEPEMIYSAIEYWHSDNERFKSPFPDYIKETCGKEAVDKFIEWTDTIPDDEAKKMEEDIFLEKFEEILFLCGSNLVKTEDEKLTLLYPFMPRIGDKMVKSPEESEKYGTITDRAIKKDGDHAFLEVKIKSDDSDETWKTSFELPV